MRFPLFISSKPQIGITSMRVKIGAGKWKIEHDCVDSKLNILLNDLPRAPQEFDLAFVGFVSATVEHAGTEQAINVYVCSLPAAE